MFKKIKRFFIFFLISFLVCLPIFAKQDAQVSLEISDSEISLGESFDLALVLKYASTGDLNMGDLDISGLENFQELSSQKSTQIQMLNGATTVVTRITKKLKANKEGEFVIGPLKIANTEIKSNSVKIVIKKENKSFFQDDDENIVVLSSSRKQRSFFNKDLFINVLMFFLLAFMFFALTKREKMELAMEKIKNRFQKNNLVDDIIDKKEEQVDNLNLPNLDDEKFFEKVKENLSKYIQNNFGINTDSLTSKEILDKLKEKKFFKFSEIEEIFRLCDQARFANSQEDKERIVYLWKNIF